MEENSATFLGFGVKRGGALTESSPIGAMLDDNHAIPFHWETHMTVWSSCLTLPRPATGAAHLAALLGALLLLGACGAHDRLADYRPVVDS